MKYKIINILGHVAGILFFLSIPIVFAPGQSLSTASLRELFSYLLMVGFFYLNYYLLIPRLYFNKKYFWFILIVLGCYLFITFLPQYLFQFAPPPTEMGGRPSPHPHPTRGWNDEMLMHLGHTIFLFFLIALASLSLRISNKLKKTENEKINTELSFLKAQVNPHFLFNTLNSIYSLAIEKSDDTANAIVKLSGMMRYVLHDARQDYVSLERELECIRDFIDLQQIRWGDAVEVIYQQEGPAMGKSIAPFMLQPFVENAFKHGVSPEEDTKIIIHIRIEKESLHMEVLNDKVTIKPASPYESKSGLGIENTRLRLQLMYPSAHELQIKEDAKTFQVVLKLGFI